MVFLSSASLKQIFYRRLHQFQRIIEESVDLHAQHISKLLELCTGSGPAAERVSPGSEGLSPPEVTEEGTPTQEQDGAHRSQGSNLNNVHKDAHES